MTYSRAWCVVILLAASMAACAANPTLRLRPEPYIGQQRGEAIDHTPTSIEPPIEPDRPDVTNGTHIVDEGLLQVEIGAQYVRTRTTDQSSGTPITLRLGVFEWLELRAGSDGLLRQTDATTSVMGQGNVQLGAKLRLWADPGGIPVLSILPTVNLPAASVRKGLGSGDPDYTLVLLTGTDIGGTSHIDVNYGIGEIGTGQDRPHFLQHLVSASFSHSVTEQFSPYVEGFWFSRQDPDGGRVIGFDAGFIHAFTARLALDSGVSVSSGQEAMSISAFGGVSMIVGDVLGDHGVLARQRKAARIRTRRAQ